MPHPFPALDGSTPATRQFNDVPEMGIDPSKRYTATFLASAVAALVGGFGLSAAGYPAMAIAGAAIAGTTTVIVLALRQMTTRSLGTMVTSPAG